MFEYLKFRKPRGPSIDSQWRMSRLWMGDSLPVVGLALLRIIAVAQREGLALPPLVRVLAEEHRGLARRRLRQLARLLETGTPLIQAIEQTRNLLDDEDVLMLQFANQTGTLQPAYSALIQRAVGRSHEAAFQVRRALLYGACLTIVTGLALTFLMLFVAPTFVAMFEQFGLRLPGFTVALIQATSSLAKILPLVLLASPLLIAGLWYVSPTRFWRHWLSSRMFRSATQLRVAGLLRMLAMALAAGRPLSRSLSTLAHYHFDRGVRVKLLIARNEVEQGIEYWTSLSNANLLSDQEARSLAGASNNALRVWLMERLARQKEQQVELRRAFLAMFVHPAIVIVLGVIVLWIFIAFFSVLISMITALS